MSDTLVRQKSALMQHGESSDRVYIMKLGSERPEPILKAALRLANENGYGKIFAKVPDAAAPAFLSAGFVTEARIPDFLDDGSGMHFMGLFIDKSRRKDVSGGKVKAVLSACRQVRPGADKRIVPPGFRLKLAGTEDAFDLAKLYRQVFASYPFPIDDPRYIRKTMRNHVLYMMAISNDGLVAACSAECHPDEGYAEMTDFATLPESRGAGLATVLLGRVESVVKKAYRLRVWMTIARSVSTGMNMVFRRHRYHFCGTLVNNTGIAGAIESMNVWYKYPRISHSD